MDRRTGLFRRTPVLLAMIVSLALAACGGGSEPAAGGGDAEGGTVELTMWTWPGMGVEEQVQQYDEDNDDVTIVQQESEFADHHTNLITALGAGSGAPCIAAVEIQFITRFKETPDQFYNLLELGAEEVTGDYLDWKIGQASTAEGVLLGLPTDIGPMAMAYRTDLFEQGGLPTEPSEVSAQIDTWEAFVEAGRKLRDQADVAMTTDGGVLFTTIVGQGEQRFFTPEGEFIGDTNPQVQYAWDIATTAITENITLGVEAFETEWGAAMANGDFAVQPAPAWMQEAMQENAPDTAGEWNLAQLPEGSGNWGGSFFTVPAQCEHPEEAYEFIEWLTSPEQQLVTFENSGLFPSTPELYDDPALTELSSEFFSGAPTGQIYTEAAENVVDVYNGADDFLVYEAFGDALQRVEDGQETPEQAWESALAEIDRQLGR